MLRYLRPSQSRDPAALRRPGEVRGVEGDHPGLHHRVGRPLVPRAQVPSPSTSSGSPPGVRTSTTISTL
jgi:hypothetical protein